MFSNIGDKIKGLATVLCIFGMLVSIVIGFGVSSMNTGLGVIYAAVGSLIAWVSSFVLYGFGELICQSKETNRKLDEIKLYLYDRDNNQY